MEKEEKNVDINIDEIESVNDYNVEETKPKNKGVDTAKMVLKTIFSIIFSIIYFAALNALVVIILIKVSFNNGLIEEIIKITEDEANKSSETSDLAYVTEKEFADNKKEAVNTKEQDSSGVINSSVEFDMDKFNFDDVNMGEIDNFFEKSIKENLARNNIPDDVVNYIEDTDENIAILTRVGANLIQYAYGLSDEYKIDEKDVNKLLNNAIDNYEYQTGNSVDRSNVDKAAATFKKDFEEYVEDNATSDVRNIINSIFNGAIFYSLVGFVIFCALMVAVLNLKNFRFLKTLAFPTIITGLTNLIVGKMILPEIEQLCKLDSLINGMTMIGLTLTIISVVMIATYYIIKATKKRRSEVYA